MKLEKPYRCFSAFLCLLITFFGNSPAQTPAPRRAPSYEYLWYEAENMRGFSVNERNEPVQNPSWSNPPRAVAPGWGINGPGVSAEWTQGGESEWNSAAASADETRATIYQDVEVPRAGAYRVWARYADWAKRTENFTIRVTQDNREVFSREFGARDLIDPHDEVSMYWGWAFTWDGAPTMLAKGAARVSVEVEKQAEARRHVDCLLLTNDPAFAPEGRRKPDFAAMRYLRDWSQKRTTLAPLIEPETKTDVPILWRRPALAGRDFLMPWNVSKDFWKLYDTKPPEERPLYPFNAEPVAEFVKTYKGARDVPLFSSRLVVPVVYIADLPSYLKEGSPFLRYLRETRAPFAVLINYGTARWPAPAEAQAAWRLLSGELREQFLGWISGESVGHVWGDASKDLKLRPEMPRREMLTALRVAYTGALERKWARIFQTPEPG
ncbi:MAG TPA: hypothetical protein VD861_15875, partial [Pyrinomonadaceae bacterium]|nr:hypothetical protein [Pyrinomonadaceae bacterium]